MISEQYIKTIKCYKIYFFLCVVIISLNGCGYIPEHHKSSTLSAPASSNYIYYKVEFSPGAATTKLIVDTINGADKSIYVAAYCLTSTPIADSLIKAHARGVNVKVVLDYSHAMNKHSKYRRLLSSGVSVRINNRYKSMHNKFMVIDNSIVETGSFNYTDNAENHNAENMLMIYNNHELVQSYLGVWEKLWNESKTVK